MSESDEQQGPVRMNLGFRKRRLKVFLIVIAVATVLSHLFDGVALRQIDYAHYYASKNATPGYEYDWMRIIRVPGSVWTWVVVGAMFVLMDSGRKLVLPLKDMWSRAAVLLLSTVSAGLVAEGLKIVFQRERPDKGLHDEAQLWGTYLWRWLGETEKGLSISSSGLGLPSSHAAVAAAGMCALCFLHPRLVLVAVPMAVLAAMSRIASGAHFLSDVVLGAGVGVLCAWLVWVMHVRVVNAWVMARQRGVEHGTLDVHA